ncbi:MAG: 1-acyl-sn-glycerol-3-phosphate acyltransferase [Clostridia bacterium]|nr:1-acyl-sn-glycerol-3-phosphate acyltransferase [Clostridia bacterium]
MKIKIIDKPYSKVMELPTPKHEKPKRMNMFWRVLIKALCATNLHRYHVEYREVGMEKLAKDEPCLVLMNHSGFIDMQIVGDYLFPRPFSVVTTTDAYVGLSWVLKQIGCIPTQKFVPDLTLIRDMAYALREKKSTVVMYPEACYSFDGTSAPLPDSIGKCLKLLKVPVVTIITRGAFTREPLYNMLQHRKVDISADVTYLLSPEDIQTMTPEELNEKVREAFSFDHFKWQQENGIRVSEDFRADGLERVLYQCPHCLAEGRTVGKGTVLTCGNCGKTYELTELGALRATDGDAAFTHIPDWFAWEREQVKGEIERGEYLLDVDVDIYMLVDYRALYRIGEGHLIHDMNGFHLTGADGELDYTQPPHASYSINSDYYFYEIGDMISIGDRRHLFYCFPKRTHAIVAKAKMAAEELYRLSRAKRRAAR